MTANQEIGKSARPPRRKTLLLSALVCPGLGQLSIGRKKRGIFLVAAFILVLLLMLVKVYSITTRSITPELIMQPSISEFISVFFTIRSRVYSESVPYLVTLGAVWLTAIIDILLTRENGKGPRSNV